MSQILAATRHVLRLRSYCLGFLLGTPMVFFLLVTIPVVAIPFNTYLFQLKIFFFRDYLLLVILSILVSLFLTMQVRSIALNRIARQRTDVVAHGFLGTAGAIIGSIFGTAACASCVAALLGFLGFGTVLFLLQFRWLITLFAVGLMFVSLYLSARRLNGLCEACKVSA